MEQLDLKFKQILDYLSDSTTSSHHTGDKQICYLTYPFEDILTVKRKLTTWMSLSAHYDYNTHVLSIGDTIQDFLKNNPRRSNWLAFTEIEYLEDLHELYKGLSSAVVQNRVLETAILQKQKEVLKGTKPLLVITDLEGIHPYTRFGPVEQNIYNQIEIPIIILYPGKLSGSSLEFLGFYPPDGNYRSKHF